MANKKTKRKLKIGSLVFVKTRSMFDHANIPNTTITNIPYSKYNPQQLTVEPNWVVSPSVTTDYLTTQINNYQYLNNELIEHPTKTQDLATKEELNNLTELYNEYQKNYSNSYKVTNKKLGMSVWHGPPTITATIPVSNTVYSYTTNNIKIDLDYYAHGYEKIEDFPVHKVVQIKQEETPDANSGSNSFYGKSFNGIIVDLFKPTMKTEKGEEVAVNHLPKMYKVLFGENKCLWFPEEDVKLMDRQ